MSAITATPSVQIKVTLPEKLQELVQSKADQYGLTISTYIKHLVLNDVKDMDMPVFPMSEKTEETGLKALKEYKEGKTIAVEDVDKFFDNL